MKKGPISSARRDKTIDLVSHLALSPLVVTLQVCIGVPGNCREEVSGGGGVLMMANDGNKRVCELSRNEPALSEWTKLASSGQLPACVPTVYVTGT